MKASKPEAVNPESLLAPLVDVAPAYTMCTVMYWDQKYFRDLARAKIRATIEDLRGAADALEKNLLAAEKDCP